MGRSSQLRANSAQLIALRAWLVLENKFSSLSYANIFHLKNRLQTINKGDPTIQEYLQQIKNLTDTLTAIATLVDDEDAILFTLNGLLSTFNSFKTAVHLQSNPITLLELQEFPFIEDCQLSFSAKENTITSFALAVTNNNNPDSSRASKGRFKGKFHGRGKYRFSNHRLKFFFQICDKQGHAAPNYYYHFDNKFQQQQHGKNTYGSMNNNLAYVASTLELPDPSWYLDTGANNHVTPDLSALSLLNPYNGPLRVSVRNGQNLPILHIGQGIIPTSNHYFSLTNLHHVPALSKNLLSIQKFVADNNCHMLFDESCFMVQDKATSRVMCRGPCKNGLYPILVPGTSKKLHTLVALSAQQTITTTSHNSWAIPVPNIFVQF